MVIWSISVIRVVSRCNFGSNMCCSNIGSRCLGNNCRCRSNNSRCRSNIRCRLNNLFFSKLRLLLIEYCIFLSCFFIHHYENPEKNKFECLRIDHLNNYLRLHVCLSFRPSVRPSVEHPFFSNSCSHFTKCH